MKMRRYGMIADALERATDAAIAAKVPMMTAVPQGIADENGREFQIMCNGNGKEFVEMFGAMFLSNKVLYKAAKAAMKGIEDSGGDTDATASAYDEKIERNIADEEMEKHCNTVEDLMNLIRTVDGKDNPTVVLTRIDGCLQSHVQGAPEDIASLLAETMIRNEGFMTVGTQAADAAVTYIEKHPEGIKED